MKRKGEKKEVCQKILYYDRIITNAQVEGKAILQF